MADQTEQTVKERLRKAGLNAEFEALKGGRAFELKEVAGIHIVSVDEEKPPIMQVTGDFGMIVSMFAFAISEIIDTAAEQGVDRDYIKNAFKDCLELAFQTSGKGKKIMKEKMNLPLEQFLTLTGPAQILQIAEEGAEEPLFVGKAAKIRNSDKEQDPEERAKLEAILAREVKFIQPAADTENAGKYIFKIWLYPVAA